MEPQLPSPQFGPERAPAQPERAPQQPPSSESAPSTEQANERHETREQQPSGPSDPAAVQAPPASPPPLPQITHTLHDNSQASADDNPAIAADEDLIEKEWIEKAKRVIAETKHDPYLQEQAVSKLQADYLQKRYNKTVKVPNESS